MATNPTLKITKGAPLQANDVRRVCTKSKVFHFLIELIHAIKEAKFMRFEQAITATTQDRHGAELSVRTARSWPVSSVGSWWCGCNSAGSADALRPRNPLPIGVRRPQPPDRHRPQVMTSPEGVHRRDRLRCAELQTTAVHLMHYR